MILAGDIGGTNTRLAFFEVHDTRLKLVCEERYPSREHASLGEIARGFLDENQLWPSHACFGIAGPVVAGRSVTTNLPWIVDSAELSATLKITNLSLVNDLEANGFGVAVLGEKDLVTLNEGRAAPFTNSAVIAAGTGLGEAGLYCGIEPFATEGGHADFSPRNDLEQELLRFLMTRFYDHVSWERVLSGPGLRNLYDFFRGRSREREPSWLRDEIAEKGPAAVSKAGLEGKDGAAVLALDLFVTLYGSEAGNLALKVMATSGLYVGGGIAPRIVEKIRTGAFMDAFAAKGRMRSLLEAIPVRLILNDKTALLGAARRALRGDPAYVRVNAWEG